MKTETSVLQTDAIQSEWLTTRAAFESLEPEWLELWENSANATPFQSPIWLVPWWRHFGNNHLWCCAMRCDGALVGFAPLLIDHLDSPGPRGVFFLGTGVSDYLDILARRGFEKIVANEFFRQLAERRGEWDVCDFQELRRDSILLSADFQKDFSLEKTVQENCLVLELPNKNAELSNAIPKGALEKLLYYRRRAERAGTVQIEAAAENNFEKLFDEFVRLHFARWNERGGDGVLVGNAIQNFHREAARGFLKLNLLRLYALCLDGRIIATLYGFEFRGRFFYYLGGFDPQFSKLNPGTLIIGHAIEQALRVGASEFDFLRGREKYKYAWGAKERKNFRVIATNRAAESNRANY
ncbi:MAG TPA: GNAT family N-acetyltransferase [Verrucomicrobiae bacterium]|nr:GNAT family N-acetyltransferase [Verrucomicrobiae bacterium]